MTRWRRFLVVNAISKRSTGFPPWKPLYQQKIIHDTGLLKSEQFQFLNLCLLIFTTSQFHRETFRMKRWGLICLGTIVVQQFSCCSVETGEDGVTDK